MRREKQVYSSRPDEQHEGRRVERRENKVSTMVIIGCIAA